MNELAPPRIVCAALRCSDGTVIASARHFDRVMHGQLSLVRDENKKRPVQGFIDQHGEFYTRHEAWRIAVDNLQVVRRCGGDGPEGVGLFSENMY